MSHHLSAFILASGSPRRRQMLAELGYAFSVRPPAVDESPFDLEAPGAYVERLARAKAAAVEADDLPVLAADTIVVFEGDLLGKPTDDADAATMLRRLAGREHEVLTAIAVAHPRGRIHAHVERTRVWIGPLDEATARWYVASGEPRDKAGAYAIQGLGAVFVERIEGNYSNVVGLPIPAACRLLAEAGVRLPEPRPKLGVGAPSPARRRAG